MIDTLQVYVEHTPTSGSSAEMELLVTVSQVNFVLGTHMIDVLSAVHRW